MPPILAALAALLLAGGIYAAGYRAGDAKATSHALEALATANRQADATRATNDAHRAALAPILAAHAATSTAARLKGQRHVIATPSPALADCLAPDRQLLDAAIDAANADTAERMPPTLPTTADPAE